MGYHLYLYFSGTGNTKHVIDRLASHDTDHSPVVLSIESGEDFDALIKDASRIVVGYPIYESMMPMIMDAFLEQHREAFLGKEIVTVVTQMMFSGDGGALAWRKLGTKNVRLLHSIHVDMPNNITDVRILPAKTVGEIRSKVEKADRNVDRIADLINKGKRIKHGIRWYSRALGSILQRSYAKPFYGHMATMLKVNPDTCVMCGKCVQICPTENLEEKDGAIITKGVCTACYRCVNACPVQAITLIGKKPPKKQYLRETYR